MSTSRATLPSGSEPGIVAASGAFGGSPSYPAYFAGTRTALTPPMFGTVPATGGVPSVQYLNE